MNPRLVACFGLMVLSLMGCKERRSDVYCIAFRYGHADAGSPALGSPFEDTLGGGEIGRSDVIMAPHIFIATKDGATMSHLTHQFWDEPVREVQDGGSAFIVGSNGEQHPIVWKRVGEERRLRYGFAGCISSMSAKLF